jgi:hypothetical protein
LLKTWPRVWSLLLLLLILLPLLSESTLQKRVSVSLLLHYCLEVFSAIFLSLYSTSTSCSSSYFEFSTTGKRRKARVAEVRLLLLFWVPPSSASVKTWCCPSLWLRRVPVWRAKKSETRH